LPLSERLKGNGKRGKCLLDDCRGAKPGGNAGEMQKIRAVRK
jgi:hypothetical protein